MRKIVLTGGPCSGKSTSLVEIKKSLQELGYKVFIIDETATRLINKGIYPNNTNGLTMYEFEKRVMRLQLILEKLARLKSMFYKKSVILCDRGLLDCKAYLDEVKWNMLLDEMHLNEGKMLNRYDTVIHLVTIADGKKELYTTENNKARQENALEALEKDKITLTSWIGHSNLYVVDNSTDFKNKIERVKKFIFSTLGEEETTKQYKFEVDLDNNSLYKLKAISEVSYIVQTYLKSFDKLEKRIRKFVTKGQAFYYYTEKKELSSGEIIKTSKQLTKFEYNALLKNADPNLEQIEKTRYSFRENKSLYHLDIFNDGNNILEVETNDNLDNVVLPSFLKSSREIDVSNKDIAKKLIKKSK